MAVLKADPKARLIALCIVLISTFIIFLLVQWLLPEFDAYLKQKQPKEAINILRIALSLTFLLCLPIAAYLYRIGNRILKVGQFPFPKAKVLRDTEIITGEAAHRKGHEIKRLSLCLALVSLYCAFYFYYSSVFTNILKIKNSPFLSSFKTYGISFVILVILFGIALLICKWIDSYLSNNQTKEKEIKQKIIIQDKKTLFRNIVGYMLPTGITMMLASPYYWIFEFVFRLLFPLPIKGTVAQLFAMIYLTISIIICFVLLIYTWRWLKKYFDMSG